MTFIVIFYAVVAAVELEINSVLQERLAALSAPKIRKFVIPSGDYGKY